MRRKDRQITLNPSLTIVLTVQPSVIQRMSEKRAFLSNGTLERFLYVLPKSNLGYRTHNKPAPSTEIENAYHEQVKKLLDQFSLFKRATKLLNTLTLSPIALSNWRDFQADIEEQLRPEGKFFSCQGWAGKICGFTLRIAGLLHVAEHCTETPIISENTMANAIQIAAILAEHAIAAFGLMDMDQATQDAKTIFKWIKSRREISFTQSDILLAMRNKKLGKSERLLKAMSILCERHILSAPIKLLTTRKPTTIYYVNPLIFTS